MPVYLMNKLVYSCSLHDHVSHLQGMVHRDCQVSHTHLTLSYLTECRELFDIMQSSIYVRSFARHLQIKIT